MISLLLSILCSSLIFVLFKAFARFEVNLFQAIVVNYAVAFLFGVGVASQQGEAWPSLTEPFVLLGLGLGVLFISIFFLMGLTSQKLGVAVSSIAVKMSLVLPVFAFAALEKETTLEWPFLVGLVLAVVAIVLVSGKAQPAKGTTSSMGWRDLWMPMAVFLGSGIIDFSLGYGQNYLLGGSDFNERVFASLPFLGALIFGGLALIFQAMRGTFKPDPKSLLWGLILGLINYFSIYFLLRIFGEKWLSTEQVIPVNNLGVVLLSALLAVLLFKEPFSKRKVLGLVVAVGALLLLV